jgi:hypothetical protein
MAEEIPAVVVMSSGGLSSFAAGVRAVGRFSAARVTMLLTDTTIEDADCYRFLYETADVLGVRLATVADGREPWDVADDEGFIPNSRVPLCSRRLKHEPGQRWLTEHAPDALVVLGIGWHEQHRAPDIAAGHLPRETWFPMIEPPYLDNDGLARLARSFGIEPPRMYAAGYAHANCSGGCLRAGHAAWRHLLRDSPLLFAYHEWREQNWRRRWGRDAAVLRWRSGPLEGRPMTLQTLRRLCETSRDDQLDLFEWGGCGCTPGATDLGMPRVA